MTWTDCDLGARAKSRARVREVMGAGSGQVVMHRCDEPRCANPEHLSVGTQAENLADAWRKGRLRGSVGRGEQHQQARLTVGDVLVIRRLAAEGFSQRDIARQYGVHQSAISRVISGKRWGHV